jgi:hypothetical protein
MVQKPACNIVFSNFVITASSSKIHSVIRHFGRDRGIIIFVLNRSEFVKSYYICTAIPDRGVETYYRFHLPRNWPLSMNERSRDFFCVCTISHIVWRGWLYVSFHSGQASSSGRCTLIATPFYMRCRTICWTGGCFQTHIFTIKKRESNKRSKVWGK